jgi:hypothetical protein
VGFAVWNGGERAYRATSPGGTLGSASQNGRATAPKAAPECEGRLTLRSGRS